MSMLPNLTYFWIIIWTFYFVQRQWSYNCFSSRQFTRKYMYFMWWHGAIKIDTEIQKWITYFYLFKITFFGTFYESVCNYVIWSYFGARNYAFVFHPILEALIKYGNYALLHYHFIILLNNNSESGLFVPMGSITPRACTDNTSLLSFLVVAPTKQM